MPEKVELSLPKINAYLEFCASHKTRATVDELAKFVGMSRVTLNQRCKQLFNLTAHEYLAERRHHAAATLMKTSRDRLGAIALKTGYGTERSFQRAFKRRTGKPPRNHRPENRPTLSKRR